MNNKQIDKNLPNKLTILRILLVPVFIIVLWLPMITGNSNIEFASKITAALIFAFSAITDFVDGKIARKYNLVSNFGKFRSPLADKFLITERFLPLFLSIKNLPLCLSALLITVFRELAGVFYATRSKKRRRSRNCCCTAGKN